ncbi:MAG: EamA family transporter [Microbacteriaceae bacterium]|nr:EamA family transporter [Microbacteriaceae bacterium]
MCKHLDVRYVFFAFLAAILFGTTGTAQALGPSSATSLSVGSARIVIGGFALAAIALVLWLRNHRALRSEDVPSVPISRNWWVVVVGAAAIIAYQPAFFLGTATNGVAIGTVVAIGSGPILTGLFEWLLFRKFPGLIWVVATIVAIVGIWLLSGVGGSHPAKPSGILLSLGAGACYAIYALSAKKLLLDGWSPSGSVALIFGASAVGALPILFATNLAWITTPTGIAVAVWMGIGTITIACIFLAIGLKHLAASTVATLGLGEPLTATLLGVIVLHETLSTNSIIGLGLVVFGLLLIGTVKARQPRKVQSEALTEVQSEVRAHEAAAS